MHLGMTLRLADDHSFEAGFEDMTFQVKELLQGIDIEQAVTKYKEDVSDPAYWFDFKTDRKLRLFDIIDAALHNTDRLRLKDMPGDFKTSLLCEGEEIGDILKSQIEDELNDVKKAFDKAQFDLYDTSKLYEEVDKQKWIHNLKESLWYGPFKTQSCDHYHFYSQNKSGSSISGIVIPIYVKDKQIRVTMAQSQNSVLKSLRAKSKAITYRKELSPIYFAISQARNR